MIHVDNIRLGHASNSSSTHSILVLPGSAQEQGISPVAPDMGLQQFGWDQFTLTETEDKLRYFNQILANALDVPAWIKPQAVEGITGIPYDPDGFIDHQSMWNLPRDMSTGHVHEGFARAVAAYFGREDVVILGGNDNGGTHPLREQAETSTSDWSVQRFDMEKHFSRVVYARQEGDWWVTFDPVFGNKVTISFEKNPKPRERAPVPELLDIKINQYCPFGCAFCSQSSTMDGSHADLFRHSWARSLARWGVFEVALGGGEPTLHPGLNTFIDEARKANLNVSLTTRNLAWLRSLGPDIGCHIRAVGFSCHSPEEVFKVAAARPTFPGAPSIRLHVVVGTMPLDDIVEIVARAQEHKLEVLLLGYKPVGFGKDFETHDMTGLYERIITSVETAGWRDSGPWRYLGIDTQLAKAWEEGLRANNLDTYFYTLEGSRSGYLDLMEMELRPSSYAPAEYSVPLADTNGRWFDVQERMQEAWDKMRVYEPTVYLECV